MDPYRTFHGLADDFRPLGDPAGEPRPPASLRRLKAFVYACAMAAHEDEANKVSAMAGGGAARGR